MVSGLHFWVRSCWKNFTCFLCQSRVYKGMSQGVFWWVFSYKNVTPTGQWSSAVVNKKGCVGCLLHPYVVRVENCKVEHTDLETKKKSNLEVEAQWPPTRVCWFGRPKVCTGSKKLEVASSPSFFETYAEYKEWPLG